MCEVNPSDKILGSHEFEKVRSMHMPHAQKLGEHRVQSLLLVVSSLILAGWIIYLMSALPNSYRAAHWDIAWVGFDIAMMIVLLATSWALWNRRQAAIPGAMVSGTFLIIDSWFDVVTSNPGLDFKIALASAIFIELPSAFLLFRFSRMAVRRSILNAHQKAGRQASTISIWRTPLMIFDKE